MQFVRNHKKLSMIVLLILFFLLIFGFTYARYIYRIIDNYILESKGFYFNSSVLSLSDKSYKIHNWDGVNNYILTVDVNNKKNESVSTTTDISYSISVECSDNVTCTLSKETGIIYEQQKTDTYQITIIPKGNFYEGDEVTVKTQATSTSPYYKTLSATYIVGVEKSKFSYSIEDSANSQYLILNLTNSIGYYEVEKAFDTYQVGDQISLDNYMELSDAEKENCFSAKVTLSFDPKVLYLDMTSNSYLKKISDSEVTEKINGFDYVSKYTFKVDATSSEKILFYKDDIAKDYTYPIVNEDSIIDVLVVSAE